MKLNLGGIADGYVCIDRKLGSEAYPLSYEDNSADEIRASHILEHFGRGEVADVLKDWVRVLKPGCYLKIAVPDFNYIVKHLEDEMWQGYLFGGQTDENDFHKVAFTEDILGGVLVAAGLEDIGPWKDDVDDSAAMPVSLNLQGRKPKPLEIEQGFDREGHLRDQIADWRVAHAQTIKDKPAEVQGYDKGWGNLELAKQLGVQPGEKPTKIVAVMSCPRLGWTDNFGCIQEVFMPLGIPVFRHSGVFWGQGLSELMENAVEHDAEFIITLDYDTVFSREHVVKLCQLIIENEDIDCIVPLQIRRENNYSMFTMRGADKKLMTTCKRSEFERPLTKISTGHFGLTIIRCSSLARMKRPWFLAIPDLNGGWREGHIDEDIYFWLNAESAGWNVCLANDVKIGHLQNVITWPRKDFTPLFQYVSQWNNEGQPKEIVKNESAGADGAVEAK